MEQPHTRKLFPAVNSSELLSPILPNTNYLSTSKGFTHEKEKKKLYNGNKKKK